MSRSDLPTVPTGVIDATQDNVETARLWSTLSKLLKIYSNVLKNYWQTFRWGSTNISTIDLFFIDGLKSQVLSKQFISATNTVLDLRISQ